MGTTLTGTVISATYDSLLKVTDNDAITSTAKRITDGLGNDTPLYISSTRVGIGVSPTTTFHVSGNSQIGGNLTVTGDLLVEGSTTTIDTSTLSVEDPLIIVGSNNTTSDAVDLGIYGVYDTSGSQNLYAGIFRRAADNKFHIFRDLQSEPTTTVNLSGTGYARASLVLGTLEFESLKDLGESITVTKFVDQADGISNNDNDTTIPTSAAVKDYVDNNSGASTLSEVLANGNTSGANDIIMADTEKVNFGTDSDLFIVHSGTNGVIENSTGELFIQNASDDKDIIFKSDDGSGGLAEYFKLDGSLVNGSTTLGAVAFPDKSKIFMGTGSDFRLFHNGTYSIIQNTTGDVYIENTADDKDIIFMSDDGSGGTAVYMRIDGSDTTTVFAKNTRHNDSVLLQVGSGNDAAFYHNGTDTFLTNDTGDLKIRQFADDKNINFDCDDGSGGVTTYMSMNGAVGFTINYKLQNFQDDVSATFGNDSDLSIYHNGTTNNSNIENNTGSLYVTNYADDEDIVFRSDDGSGGVTEYFRIDGGTESNVFSKSVGIGTDSPAVKLHVDGGDLRVRDSGNVSIQIVSSNSSNSAIQFGDDGDTNDGRIVYENTGDNMLFYTNDSERMRIDSSGNVAIGNTSPNEKLDVSGSVRIGNMKLQNVNGGRIGFNRNTADGAIYNSSFSAFQINGASSGIDYLSFEAYNSSGTFQSQMVFTSSGNLGIGTTSPGTKLHIDSSSFNDHITLSRSSSELGITVSGTQLLFEGGVSPFGNNAEDLGRSDKHWNEIYVGNVRSSGNLILKSNGNNERVRIDSSGNVGIGATSPSAQLHVHATSGDGLIRVTGDNITNSGGAIKGFNNGLAFNVAASGGGSETEAIRIIGNANVGIGTTSPSEKLEVAGSIRIDNGASFTSYQVYRDNIKYGDVGGGSNQFTIQAANNKNINLFDDSGVGLTVKDGGNVGIGTTSPSTKLHTVQATENWIYVETSGTNAVAGLRTSTSTGTRQNTLYRNVTTNLLTLRSGTDDGEIQFIAGGSSAERMRIESDGTSILRGLVKINTGAQSSNPRLYFQHDDLDVNNFIEVDRGTGAMEFYNNGSERMRIDSSGNVGIGTTAPNQSSYSTDSKVVTVKAPVSGGASVLELIGLANADGNLAGAVSFMSYAESTPLASIKGLRHTSDTSGKLRFDTAGSERMRITETGNVGIGTTSLSGNDAKLIIDSGDGKHPAIKVSDGGANGFTMLADNYTATESQFSIGVGYSGGQGVISHNCKVSDVANNTFLSSNAQGATKPMALSFDAGNFIFRNTNTSATTAVDSSVSLTERMRINSAGNVGIGTTSPEQILHIKDTSNPSSPKGSVIIEGQRDGTANLMELRARDNSSPNSALPGGQGGIIRMNGFDGTDFEEMAFIGYQAEATVADGDAPSRLIFGTTSNGSGVTTEKMRLQSNGDLHADGDVIAYSTTISDARLKDNVKPLESSLDKIMNLKGVEYTWNNGSRKGQKDIGFIAQEVEDVIPEIVREKEVLFDEDTKYKTVDYEKITAVLVEAVKELQQEIVELKKQIK